MKIIILFAGLLGLVACSSNFDESKSLPHTQKEFDDASQHDRKELLKVKRSELPQNLKRLEKAIDPSMRAFLISEIARAIKPETIPMLIAIFRDQQEGAEPRLAAVQGLHYMTYYGSSPVPEYQSQLDTVIRPALVDEFARATPEFKKALAVLVYTFGAQDTARPVLMNMLREGDQHALSAFASSGEVWPNAQADLKRALGKEFPDKIRIETSSILINMAHDKENLTGPLADILQRSPDRDSRILALHLLHDIGTDEAKEITRSALKIPEMHATAKRILEDLWHERPIVE